MSTRIYICRQYSHVGYGPEMYITKYPLLAREWANKNSGTYCNVHVGVYDVSADNEVAIARDESYVISGKERKVRRQE